MPPRKVSNLSASTRNARRLRLARQNESSTEKEIRLAKYRKKIALNLRHTRPLNKDEKRVLKLELDRIRKAECRARETSEQRSLRLKKDRERKALIRASKSRHDNSLEQNGIVDIKITDITSLCRQVGEPTVVWLEQFKIDTDSDEDRLAVIKFPKHHKITKPIQIPVQMDQKLHKVDVVVDTNVVVKTERCDQANEEMDHDSGLLTPKMAVQSNFHNIA